MDKLIEQLIISYLNDHASKDINLSEININIDRIYQTVSIHPKEAETFTYGNDEVKYINVYIKSGDVTINSLKDVHDMMEATIFLYDDDYYILD